METYGEWINGCTVINLETRWSEWSASPILPLNTPEKELGGGPKPVWTLGSIEESHAPAGIRTQASCAQPYAMLTANRLLVNTT
jgi:hypothetical protein